MAFPWAKHPEMVDASKACADRMLLPYILHPPRDLWAMDMLREPVIPRARRSRFARMGYNTLRD